MEYNLPEGIIIEILSWLPVKSLFMFKTVSKLWHSLISNKFFVEKHAQNQMITYYGNNDHILMRDNHKREVHKSLIQRLKSKVKTCTTTWLMLQRKGPTCYHPRVINTRDRRRNSNCLMIGGIKSGNYGKYVVLLKDGKEVKKSLILKNEHQDINCGFLDGSYSRRIGSCNGLICICGHKDEIALWNPTIGDLKVVPPSQLQRGDTENYSDVGFGFDSCTNDYKVIHVLYRLYKGFSLVYQIEIYSLNTNSWRKYDPSTILGGLKTPFDQHGEWMVHKNEFFCWLALSKKNSSCKNLYNGIADVDDQTIISSYNGIAHEDEQVILSFDMREEVFRTTKVPRKDPPHNVGSMVTMLPFHDSIALVFYDSCFDNISFEIWCIKDLQENESWTKLLKLSSIFRRWLHPCGFWNNGEFMVLIDRSREVLLYDLRRRKVMMTGFQGNGGASISYVETLVPVNGYQ